MFIQWNYSRDVRWDRMEGVAMEWERLYVHLVFVN